MSSTTDPRLQRSTDGLGRGLLSTANRPPDVDGPAVVDSSRVADLVGGMLGELFDSVVPTDRPAALLFTLSPSTPFVSASSGAGEHSGHLELLLNRTLSCTDRGSAGFLAADAVRAGFEGRVEVWLGALDAERSYVANLRVRSRAVTGTSFVIRSSFDQPRTEGAQAGAGQVVSVFLPGGEHRETEVLHIEGPGLDWSFFGVDLYGF